MILYLLRDGKHRSGSRAWPVKNCRGTVLGRDILGSQISGTGCYGTGFLGWAEGGYVGLQGPAFFSSSFFFLFYLKKKREGVRRR